MTVRDLKQLFDLLQVSDDAPVLVFDGVGYPEIKTVHSTVDNLNNQRVVILATNLLHLGTSLADPSGVAATGVDADDGVPLPAIDNC